MNRDAIKSALFDLVKVAANFVTVGERLVMWTNVPPEQQPALYLREGDEDHPARAAQQMPPRRTLDFEVWIYTKLDIARANATDGSLPVPLGTLIGAVEDALRPPPVIGRVTLGGLVTHCWIEGLVIKDDGALTGQALAKIPIRILVP
ncbi:MAG: hypothetical protein JWO51_149 [Rhodospirillales bacterium]|nr:hypothetical protein [Rhodospirillales bacterium]